MIELLSPVGDFECLKAAVQNGANAVYLGSSLFSARAFAANFDDEELQNAINYAKLRGVKTHLTLNTLIKNNEFEDAFNLAKKAYSFGIDALIVQDLGLATTLIKAFPDLEIHASTQMTTTNLEGVKNLEKLGFKRVVLSRECSLSEIEHICKNTSSEIEVFAHGALCISYSGQCLFSSMVGGRSGNRGACAQPCRLPYSLLDENDKILDKGYLLSTKDLYTLENLPNLIKTGVKSLKIEGRMKSPIYVATVTRIYRKYIDLAEKYLAGEVSNYFVDEKDKKDLLQVFNRGGFSSGHLDEKPNKNLIFKNKPNNMGIYLGKILKYNKNKGHVTVKLENSVNIGDSITFDNEQTKYTISELMDKNKNIKSGAISQTVTLGRMKGNINISDKIYKIADKDLSTNANNSFAKEFRTTPLMCKLNFAFNKKVLIYVKSPVFNTELNFEYDFLPEHSQNAPITKNKILAQFNKTLNTCFTFSNIKINLEDNLFIPTSILNDIRREAINRIEEKILASFKRDASNINMPTFPSSNNSTDKSKSLLLNILNKNLDYYKLNSVDRIYIPLKYFKDFENIIHTLETKGKIYIYMPNIIKDNHFEAIKNMVSYALENYNISGAVISNVSELSLFEGLDIELVANYTLNLYNDFTADALKKLRLDKITISPEFKELSDLSSLNTNAELIVKGTIPLMTMSYCLLGKTNKCFKECSHNCLSNNKYSLKDRYNFTFRVVPDNTQTITTIFNSRKIDIDYSSLNVSSIRFDVLDENIEEINDMIKDIAN